MKLRGANVLLTGAGGGLGGHIAPALAKAGANVALADVPGADLAERAAAVEALGVRATTHGSDLTDLEGLSALTAGVKRDLGEIDVLVNNAGVEFASDFLKNTPREIELTLMVNVGATIELTRLVLPGMLERGRGHIVNIASLSAVVPSPYLSVYGASKHAVRGFTHSLRGELGDRPVGVSAICPGFVRKVGMYADATGDKDPPRTIGGTEASKVGEAVVGAVEHDRAEVIVNVPPLRPMAVLYAISPRSALALAKRMGGLEVVKDFARGRGKL